MKYRTRIFEGPNKGYSGYSKSVRAVQAEREGRYPLTTVAKMTKIPAELIKKYVSTQEWHHTSKMFNKTPYYDLEDVLVTFGKAPETEDYSPNREAIESLSRYGKSEYRISDAKIIWQERGEKKQIENTTAVLNGPFLYFKDSNGQSLKKRLDSDDLSYLGTMDDGTRLVSFLGKIQTSDDVEDYIRVWKGKHIDF